MADVDYKDGYGTIKEGDIFIPYSVGYSCPMIWVYPENGQPVPLQILLNCFSMKI